MNARTITTAADLDALPVGSVVLDGDGDAWQRCGVPDRPWMLVGQYDAETTETLAGQTQPLTVLHDPSTPAREDGEVEHLRSVLVMVNRNARALLTQRDAARAEVAALWAGIEDAIRKAERRPHVFVEVATLRALLAAHPAPEAAPPTLTVTRERADRAAAQLVHNDDVEDALWCGVCRSGCDDCRAKAGDTIHAVLDALGVTVVDAP